MSAETQVLLGQPPQWHPSWWVVFWATFMAYWLHGHWPSPQNSFAATSAEGGWRTKKAWLYMTAPLAMVWSFYQWQSHPWAVGLFVLLAALTFVYSYPFAHPQLKFLHLRKLPFVKIFCIAGVWSAATVVLPALYLPAGISTSALWGLSAERFVFVVAITLPFDIRDMAADQKEGLTTIPLKMGADPAHYLSLALVLLFMAMVAWQYTLPTQKGICLALLVSGFTTLLALTNKTLQQQSFYHKGILDGTLLLQALLVLFAQKA